MDDILLCFLACFVVVSKGLNITTNGSPILGEELNISCRFLQPLHSDTEVVLSLEKKDSDEGSGGIVFNSNNDLAVHINLNPVQPNDGGTYICTATLVTMNSTNSTISFTDEFTIEHNITVKFPIPNIIVDAFPSPPVFIGENISLICRVEPVNITGILYTIIITWQKDTAILKQASEIHSMQENMTAVERVSLKLDQVAEAEESSITKYTCEVDLVPVFNSPFLAGVNYNNNITLSSKDPPLVTITHRGVQNIGSASEYYINCSMNHADNASGIDVNLVWYKLDYDQDSSSNEELVVSTDNNTTVQPSSKPCSGFIVVLFNGLSRHNAGTYTCKAMVSDRIIAMAQTQLLLTTPFNITLSQSTAFNIVISWTTPLSFIGHKVNYTIVTNITGAIATPLPPSSNNITSSYNISGLRPYQYVEVTITASTVSVVGDQVTLTFVTNEYVPGPVDGLTVMVINKTSVNVIWEPVSPGKANGIIIGYLIDLYEGGNILQQLQLLSDMDNTNPISITLNNLVPETQYSVQVRVRNSLYAVLAPPPQIKVHRLNHTHLTITWSAINDSRGFVQYYRVAVASSPEQTHTITPPPLSNEVTLVISNMDTIYGVRVATVNGEGVAGPWSPWVTNAESAIIQLRGGPFKSCTIWSEQDESSIIMLFKQSLVNFTQSFCNCSITNIFANDSLSCDQTTPTDAIYRTSITGIYPYTTVQLVGIISQWVMGGATITSGITQIALNSQCMVAIETREELFCPPDNTLDETKSSGPQVVVISVLLAVVILFCLIAMTIICIYTLIWRAQHIHTWRFHPCPTPEGHPWVYEQKQRFQDNTLFVNASIEGFEGDDEEGAESSQSTVGCSTKSDEGKDSLSRDDSDEHGDLESGVYDPSNLTIIYESDHESTRL